MKIGIDCRAITAQKTGVGYYTYHITKNLVENYPQDKFFLYFSAESQNEAQAFNRPNVEIRILPRKFLPFIYSHLTLARFFGRDDLDILFAPAGVTPLFYECDTVATIHDLAIYKNPDWFPAGQWFSTKIALPRTLKKASKIIAVSESTKKDIIEIFGTDEHKISVVYEGVDLQNFSPAKISTEISGGQARPYILFVGTLEPRKNLVNLIKAFSGELSEKYDLVIAGGRGWKYEPIFEAARGERNIIFKDYVSEDEKIRLLQGAEVFVFPTLYEGFGLPVLEALACGTKVVCSDISALREIGGDAVTYCNPLNIEDIKNSILRTISEDKVSKDNLRGQAAKFTWTRSAELVRKSFDTFMG